MIIITSKKSRTIVNALLIAVTTILLSNSTKAGFDLIPLGIYGGTYTNNMTSLLLKDSSSSSFVSLDAGSITPGIERARQYGYFGENGINTTAYVYRNLIDSYWISHGHLDHVAGLIALSPEDNHKNIYGIPSTIKTLKNGYFNWDVWPNISDKGPFPIDKYHLKSVNERSVFGIGHTGLKGVAFPLDHGINPVTKKAYPSSALLISNSKEKVIFFGDTGPDKEQNSSKLNDLWKILAYDVKNKKLKALIIECSYTNARDLSKLYGHLNPRSLLRELKKLENYSGGKGSLIGLKVFIIHVKPTENKTGEENYRKIMNELNEKNSLGVEFVQPAQGELYSITGTNEMPPN